MDNAEAIHLFFRSCAQKESPVQVTGRHMVDWKLVKNLNLLFLLRFEGLVMHENIKK